MTHFYKQQRTFSGNRERVHSDRIQGCDSIARVWIRSARDAASGHEGAAWRRSEPEDEKVGRPAVLRGPEEGRGTSRYPLFVPRAREPIVTGKLGAVEGPFHFPRGRSCWFRDVGEALSVPAAAANGRRNRRHENSSFRGYEKGEGKQSQRGRSRLRSGSGSLYQQYRSLLLDSFSGCSVDVHVDAWLYQPATTTLRVWPRLRAEARRPWDPPRKRKARHWRDELTREGGSRADTLV